MRITDGYRTYAQQDALYLKGRRKIKGEGKVTNAKGGESNHNFGLAIDIVPLKKVNGSSIPNWDSKDYPLLGKIGQDMVGLEWGGSWKTIKDNPHFQDLQGKTLKELRVLPKDTKNLPVF